MSKWKKQQKLYRSSLYRLTSHCSYTSATWTAHCPLPYPHSRIERGLGIIGKKSLSPNSRYTMLCCVSRRISSRFIVSAKFELVNLEQRLSLASHLVSGSRILSQHSSMLNRKGVSGVASRRLTSFCSPVDGSALARDVTHTGTQ
jgi:hypothetical protein